jgi:uncharacterized protein YvpB
MTRAVDVWVTAGSANPAVGCGVDVSVEVREAGGAVAGTEVLVGLVVDGAVATADRGVTGGDGLAYVAIDTSAGAPGAAARLEVSLAGSYVGRMDLELTEDGPCDGAARVVSTSASIWMPDPSEVAAAETEVAAELDEPGTGGDGAVYLPVPTYVQQRNLSCEYASLTIATGAFGGWVSEYEFDNRVGWSANPHWGYRGDITGWWGNTTDYGVYAEALVGPLAQVGYRGEAFYAEGDSGALINRLDRGMPTLVWLGLWGETGFYETMADGTSYKLVPGAHVVVAYGYDAEGVSVSDPATGGYRFYDWGTFMSMWNVFDGMGLGVAPA